MVTDTSFSRPRCHGNFPAFYSTMDTVSTAVPQPSQSPPLTLPLSPFHLTLSSLTLPSHSLPPPPLPSFSPLPLPPHSPHLTLLVSSVLRRNGLSLRSTAVGMPLNSPIYCMNWKTQSRELGLERDYYTRTLHLFSAKPSRR